MHENNPIWVIDKFLHEDFQVWHANDVTHEDVSAWEAVGLEDRLLKMPPEAQSVLDWHRLLLLVLGF